MKVYDPWVAGTRDGSGRFVHDRALLRAETAHFKPPDLDTDPKRTLFIGRLPREITEDEIRKVFVECGTVKNVRLVRHIITGASRGYAFITFKHSADVARALAMHNSDIGGRRILVEREVGRVLDGWKPRRLGGGYGGCKESGQLRFGGRACPHFGGDSLSKNRTNDRSRDRKDSSQPTRRVAREKR